LAVEFSEPVVEVAETVRLAGAAGRRILGIEIDDDGSAAQVGQRERAAVMQDALEPGHFLADRGHRQNFIGSMIASRLSPSQNSRKSSRSAAMWVVLGIPIVICAENMSAPVCIAR